MNGSVRARNRRDVALWAGWAALVAGTVALAVWALRVLIDVPGELLPWALLGLAAVPVAVVAAVLPRLRRRAGAVAGPSFVFCGLVLMVLAVYLVVVIGLGGEVDEDGQGVLAFSMAAALTAVVLAEPVRTRLRELAEQWAGRPQRPAASALETFGSRMTRAVPMDELLLQLAETLRSTLGPLGAEVWTGEDGVLERTVSVPERGAGRLTLAGAELAAVTRARVSGNAWAAMWLPSLLAAEAPSGPGARRSVRVASVTHLGRLLGLLVVVRSADDRPFSDDDDRVLADLARQVGLALHNVSLDSALQASLAELRRRNAELQASRARIVSTADASRRQIERNLHDGAQQRLVALAVKLGLARRLATGDSATLLEELRTDVQETLVELRELAHGIYPPLLREHGLGEALRNAAGRASIPVRVEADTGLRYPPDAEAAVYFCCLEALQNAAKHAGPDATVTVRIGAAEGGLEFEVADDGAGFDPAATAESHGFVNMRDRLGAFGGELTITSAPGAGAVVRGTVPTAALTPVPEAGRP
ncbi:sensor histidine kinase [Jiangella anatolica]|uniref:sensor histidine kinase n=1 Tax=Jiangella anatolica TaxID=2670374 RepID=UPI0011B5FB7A|nr:histidine kinase [Jiangella anatolica]